LALELIKQKEPGLGQLLARSMAAAPRHEHIEALVRLLAERDARSQAREALVKLGEPALGYLERSLADQSLPRRVRRHLPRTISRFESWRAAIILMRQLQHEPDPAVEFKILRGLGRIRSKLPKAPLERPVLLDIARRMVARATLVLYWRLLVDRTWNRQPSALVAAADLLSASLRDLERSSTERLFRLLHIIEPSEEFRMIYDGLKSSDPKVRAGSRELLSLVVPEGMSDGIIALVDDAPAILRLQAASEFCDADRIGRLVQALTHLETADEDRARELEVELRREYLLELNEMLHDESALLRAVVGRYVVELGQTELGLEALTKQSRAEQAEVAGSGLLEPSQPEASRAS
jgi:hypothetical protein